MKQNLIEKIAQKYAFDISENSLLKSGDYISIRPAHIMTHDNTGAVMNKFRAIGAVEMNNPRQPVFTLDHNVQDKSADNLKKYLNIEKFADEMGVDFYPAGRGIGHQIMCEEGYALPGTMVVASDSHSNMYGGLGVLGTPVVRTDAAAIWATGRTWWQIPPVVKVILNGKLNPGVTGKDVILTLCGHFNNDEALNTAIEFAGNGIKTLSVDSRLTIANMTTEWGALAGVFPIDDTTIAWLERRREVIEKRGLAGVKSDVDGIGTHPRINASTIAGLRDNYLSADEDAFYLKEITLDLSTVRPHISGPGHVKTMHSLNSVKYKNIKINKAYLVSCVNSREEDLEEAANVVKGQKIADHVKFYIAAASKEGQAESENSGDWRILLDAGAIALPPGCGPCIGLGAGLLEEGEVGISATNRNFKGRMGHPNALAYLASPATVTSSAIKGYIVSDTDYEDTPLIAAIKINQKLKTDSGELNILDGFHTSVIGELIYCHQDNLNTDGIFPGKYTYLDDFTHEQQAQVVMENYDPEFGEIVNETDILAGGYNFGTGSSREQAATALKYRGIQLVIAGSFSETYKRNALNNGYLLIESAELIDDLKEKFGDAKLTLKTKLKIVISFKKATIDFNDKIYKISAIGEAAQELIISEGLENWVRTQISQK